MAAVCDHRQRKKRGRTGLHPAWIYTLYDLLGASWGVLVFAAAVVAPGYCIASLLAPAPFRARGVREQLAWAVALSFGPGVLLLVGAVWLGGATGGAWLLLALTGAALFLARGYPPSMDVTRRQLWIALAVLAAWALLVLGSLLEVGVHNRLWMSVTAYDHGLRAAFVDAVLRTGVPPVDPVYWPGHDTPLRYYYFWYAVCASVARLAHITGRQAMIASCVPPLAGVVAMLALFGRYVLDRRGRELACLTTTAAALMAIAGLDLLVTIALRLLGTPVLPDMEWWSLDQVSSWLDTFLWVPHHAAALVAALLGLLLLSLASEAAETRTRASLAALAGLSYAAAFGMSAYIAVATALIAAGWLLTRLGSADRLRSVQSTAVAAVVSVLTLSRFLLLLAHHEASGARAASSPPLYLGIREVLTPSVMAGSLFHSLATRHPWRARELAAAILLVPGWAIELGFFTFVLIVAADRWRRSTAGERSMLWLTLSGLAAASFVRSGVISTNDYGIRAALLPQFFLLLLGAVVFSGSTGGFRRFLWILLVIGVGGSAYQLVLLRTYIPWQDTHGNPVVRQVGERTFALREAYAALQNRIPARARMQFDPASTSFYLYPHLLYSNRQMITAEITCSTSFGGDPAACPALQAGILQLFPADVLSVPNAESARRLCTQLGAQYLVVTRWDTAWAARSSWVWTLPAAVDQPSARTLSCAAETKP